MESKNQEVESGIHNLIGKLEETRANYMIDAADRRTKALQKVAELEQQIIKTRQRVSYRLLTSPVSGTVQSIKIHTKGAVVTSADTLMTIVPDDGGLEIEALIGNSDIGFVRDGQPVELKFQAFPFTRYGLVAGTIKSIGRDAATPQQIAGITGNPNATPPAYDLSYPARIAMAKTAVATEHRLEPIQPGMRVSVEIRTGSRSVMSYLLSPLIKTVKEAARER